MKIAPHNLSQFAVTLTVLFIAHNLTGQIQNESATSTNEIKIKASTVAVQTDSDREKRFKALGQEMLQLSGHWTPQRDTEFESKARLILKEFPERTESYQYMMSAIGSANEAKARSLAKEMINSPAPESFKVWARGLVNRLDLIGKPLTIQFKAIDGRDVDLTKMQGKVVLMDFWATDCGPCVAQLPRIKSVYEKFHAQGFEVVGISCDKNETKLKRFLTERNIPWPQYFDGKRQDENRFAQGFGINAIPHLMLLDKKGCLRFDKVLAIGEFTSATPVKIDVEQMDHLEQKITSLLSEQP